jgi:hypothetical protein
MADDPDHPYRVLNEFFFGIPDAADDSLPEVLQPSHVIDQRKVGNIIKDAVNGDIPPEGVFARGPEGVFGLGQVVLAVFLKLRTPPEGGDFNILPPREVDVGQAEPAADQAGIPENLPNLPGMGVGCHIKVFGGLPQKQIADASPYEISGEPLLVEPVEDLKGVRIDDFARNTMFLAGNNLGNGWLIHKIVRNSR